MYEIYRLWCNIRAWQIMKNAFFSFNFAGNLETRRRRGKCDRHTGTLHDDWQCFVHCRSAAHQTNNIPQFDQKCIAVFPSMDTAMYLSNLILTSSFPTSHHFRFAMQFQPMRLYFLHISRVKHSCNCEHDAVMHRMCAIKRKGSRQMEELNKWRTKNTLI